MVRILHAGLIYSEYALTIVIEAEPSNFLVHTVGFMRNGS